MTITENAERFQYFNFEKNFLKYENFIQTVEDYFSVQSTNMRTQHIHKKIALPDANINAKRMGSAKLTNQRERYFASKYFFFIFIFFCLRTSKKEST